MIMKIFCIECGKEFEFTEGEQNFYKKRGLEKPKRCRECRKYSIGEKLGFKSTSFFDNASVFGMPIEVKGGLSIEYFYVIEINKMNKKRYVGKGNVYNLTDDIKRALLLPEYEAKRIIEIIRKNKGYKINDLKLIPISHYQGIR